MKKFLCKQLIGYHTYMRKFFTENQYFQNDMKVIFHDLRIQRYNNKLN